jgi:hypothetical protein
MVTMLYAREEESWVVSWQLYHRESPMHLSFVLVWYNSVDTYLHIQSDQCAIRKSCTNPASQTFAVFAGSS